MRWLLVLLEVFSQLRLNYREAQEVPELGLMFPEEQQVLLPIQDWLVALHMITELPILMPLQRLLILEAIS